MKVHNRNTPHIISAIINKYQANRYKKIIINTLGNNPGVHKNNRNALIVSPFWGYDATTVYTVSICDSLKKLGYTIHVLMYNCNNHLPECYHIWDYIHILKTKNKNFGRHDMPDRNSSNIDGNYIDDWVDDDLVDFVSVLNSICDFSLCLCNYVFLSKVFTALPERTVKMLSTIDIFTKRNSRIRKLGIDRYYFSLETLEEEAKGLNRADIVFAIQEDERKYFESVVDNVYTLPYVPPKKYVLHKEYSDTYNLTVGYLASAHVPNIAAITAYAKKIMNNQNLTLYIAGSICEVLDIDQDNVKILGFVDNIDHFYTTYDLYINPDELLSGLKIKTIEALSYGRPIICTHSASAGIPITAPWHRAKDIDECVKFTSDCINNPDLLNQMRDESIRVYDDFHNKYSTYEILKKLLPDVNTYCNSALHSQDDNL